MGDRDEATQTAAMLAPSLEHKPAFGVPLSTLLVGLLLLLAIVSTGIVAVSSYRSSADTVDDLWAELAAQASAQVVQFGLRQFEPASSYARYSERQVAAGQLDPMDDEQLMLHLEAAFAAFPTIVWLSFGRVTGEYLSVYRWPTEDGWEARRTHRQVVTPDKLTWFREWTRDADGSWRSTRDARNDFYDPRKKPWMIVATKAAPNEVTWSGPFLFHSRKQTGMIMSLPSFDPTTGELLGVWAAEFEAKPLVDLLAGLEIGQGTRIYVVDRHGAIIAHPDRRVRKEGPTPAVLQFDEADDPLLEAAWTEFGTGNHAEGEPFHFDDNIAMARSFPESSKLPWTVLIVVRGEDIFAASRAQGRLAIIVAVGIVLLTLLFGIWFSGQLTKRIERLLAELLRIARFDLDGERLSDRISLVREFNEIAWAADTMKAGLLAFARYAPREVVKEVLRTGGSTELGATSRDVSVLFADIANFSTIVESSEPEIIVDALSTYLRNADEKITSTLGLRVAYLGDGVMALWGAPTSRPDHALRACECAQRFSEMSLAIAAEAQEHGRPVFRTRIGVNSGLALVGNIGAEERITYSAVGDMVNVAARLENLNKVYGTSILVGEETAKKSQDVFTFRRVDLVKAKGKYESLFVFELVGRTDELDSEVLRALKAYDAGLTHYLNGAFENATQRFKEALEAFGGRDGAASLMIRRCRQYIKTPPEDWQGVYEQR